MTTVELSNKKRVVFFLFLIVGIVSVPIFYLNCSGTNPSSDDLSSVVADIDSNQTLAYQMQVDTIAYMSCNNSNSAGFNPAFWNFKVGAYDQNTGVALSSAYTDAVQNLDPQDQWNSLSQAGGDGTNINADLYPDLSIRSLAGGSTQTIGSADTNLLGTGALLSGFAQILFSGQPWSNNQPEWHNNYYPSGETIPFAGAITYTGDYPDNTDAMQTTLRDCVTAGGSCTVTSGQQAYLMVGLADNSTTGIVIPSTPTADEATLFGYQFTFGNNSMQPNGPARAVKSVIEYNLSTGSPAPTDAQWTCGNYMIVFPSDLSILPSGLCNDSTDANSIPNQDIGNILGSGWTLIGNDCVEPASVPITGQFCSGAIPMADVNNQDNGAFGTPTGTNYSSGGSCTTSTPGSCPEILSICVRN